MAIQIRKRQKGTSYRVRLHINGRRISKSFDSRHDAMEFERDVQLNPRILQTGLLTFEMAAQEWMEKHARPRKAPGSIAGNENLLRRDLNPRFGKMRLTEIEAHHVDDMVLDLRQAMSNASVNRRLELIRSIYNYHIRRRNVPHSPMSGVSFLRVDPKPMKFWTLEEARRFLEHAKAKYDGTPRESIYLLYLLALNTGMRLGEMLALKWTAVDLTSGLISVCRTVCSHTRQVRETTKGRRIRHVPINDALFGVLEAAKARRSNVEWVLHNRGLLLDHHNIRNRHWLRDIAESSVSSIRFHDLRHTYASHFLMNGGELFKLQAILGHADIRTTMNYSHFSKAYLLENANIVRFEATGNIVPFPKKTAGSGS